MTTRCAAHADGCQQVEVRPGMNIVFETGIFGGKREVTCRRYVRETDSFVDVDPDSLEKGED